MAVVGCSPTEPENLPPDVRITAPATGLSFVTTDTVEVHAEASDPDGEIAGARLYVDGALIGFIASPPYTWRWAPGEGSRWHSTIRVVVTDDRGANTAASAGVEVKWVYRPPGQCSDDWPLGTLADVGMSREPLENLVNRLRDTDNHLVHSVVIARDGQLVFEKYFPGLSHPTYGEVPVSFDCATPHTMSSVTKSVTATLLGVAIDHDIIEDVNQPVFKYFPRLSYLATGEKAEITLEHLVTLTSGLDWDEWSLPLTDPGNDLVQFNRLAASSAEAAVEFVLARPMVATPGTELRYSGGSVNVLGKVIQDAAGQRLDHFAQEYLFTPLGVEDVTWWVFSDQLVYASGDISLRPRDLAKLGQLYLQRGRWGSKQILSTTWVKASSSAYSTFPRDPASGNVGYGYGWWIRGAPYGAGAFSAEGWGGQQLVVLPAYDMVVVLTGGSYWVAPPISPHEVLERYVIPAAAGVPVPPETDAGRD